MKEAVTKVTDMLTQEDIHGALQKLLERYNKCIATGEDYFEEDLSYMCVLFNKSAHTMNIEISKVLISFYWNLQENISIEFKRCKCNLICFISSFSSWPTQSCDNPWGLTLTKINR